jgi:hypothetical protein
MDSFFSYLQSNPFLAIITEICVSIVIAIILIKFYNFRSTDQVQWKFSQVWYRIILIGLPFVFLINAIIQTGATWKIDFSGLQNLPNYLMFFATVLSIYLLYKALTSERDASRKSAFENRFFKFMDYHRDNVSQLKYRNPKSAEKEYWEGNQVFTVIYYEICDLLLQIEKSHPSRGDRDVQQQNIDRAFQFIFFGAGERVIPILKEKYGEENLMADSFLHRKASYKNEQEDDNSNEIKAPYYSGHVRRLGHYFRNIYQMVKYVEKQKFLSPIQKYEYVTLFRAQMSVYEQSVFFFNSLSELGMVWEWKHYKKQLPSNKDEKKQLINRLLITKYDFVRNTLTNDGQIMDGVNIATFYPLINLERNPEIKVCDTLPFKDSKRICRFCFNENYIGYIDKDIGEKILEGFPSPNQKDIEDFECQEKDCVTKQKLSKWIKKHAKVRSAPFI